MSDEVQISKALRAIVDDGALAGAATLIWRDGRVVATACVGWRDIEAQLPIERDTLFRIASMTKPGLTYGAFFPGALESAYAAALGGDIDSDVGPDDWIARLPLIDEPGATLHYGHSTDLLGLLIAHIEDAPLGDILQRRIFGPARHERHRFYGPPCQGRPVRSTVWLR